MHHGHETIRHLLARRTFLAASGVGFCGLSLPSLVQARRPSVPSRPRHAKSAILIWLSGGCSHIDTFDLKPDAPAEYRGEFKPIATSAPGVRVCEYLPRIAQQARHLAVINSLGHFGRGTGDHHAGYYYNLTGHEPDPTFRQLLNNRRPYSTDWPFVGSVVAAKRPAHPYLPSLITLPQKPGAPQFTRPGQFAARIGQEFDATYLQGDIDRPTQFTVPVLTLENGMDRGRLGSRRELLHAIDRAQQALEGRLATTGYSRQQEKAFSFLTATQTKTAFDLDREPAAVHEKYGSSINAKSMLMARRLVEAGVPFISVFWMEDPRLDKLCKSAGGWDTHGSNFFCLKNSLLPEFDQCFSALIDDLHQRGLLAETLVYVTSEMGRQPKVGDPRSGGPKGSGRDHWTHCMSMLFAGGGIRGGQVYGSSDKVAAYPADRLVAPEDVAKTVYYSLGVDNLEAVDREGRPFNLMPEGDVIRGIF
jgi:hypothetical protein